MSFGIPPQQQGPYYPGPRQQQGQFRPSQEDPALGLIVPVNVRNGWAVAAGYAGIFSLVFPPLGLLGIIAGIVGLSKPELGGAGRAWTGIVLGTLTFGGLVALVLFALLAKH